jgi:hypothetical protein
MALENEIALRQADVNAATQLEAQINSAAPGMSQAITLLGQFGTALSSQSQQLATEAHDVHDLTSAGNAVVTASTIWREAQQTLRQLAPAEQSWSVVTSLAQERQNQLLARWNTTHSQPPTTALVDPLLQTLNAYGEYVQQLDAQTRSAIGVAPQPPADPVPDDPAYAARVSSWLLSGSSSLGAVAAAAAAGVTKLNTELT